MKVALKPIETIYNGYRFRSRLEARWAVFFDSAGIEYLYEPEGFDLGDEGYYLPDFYLPNVGGRARGGLWVEVKGQMTEKDYSKIIAFSNVTALFDENTEPDNARINPILCVGNIPPVDADYAVNWDSRWEEGFWNCYTVDGDWYPVEFYRETDGSVGIWGIDNVKKIKGFELMNKHYAAARQARFEYRR